jgi:hypothetical protein
LSFVSQGEFFKEGDIVSVTDVGGDIFYAQLRGFLTDEYGEKSGVIRYNHAGFQRWSLLHRNHSLLLKWLRIQDLVIAGFFFYFKAVLRIWDVYLGSRIRIFPIPDPHQII